MTLFCLLFTFQSSNTGKVDEMHYDDLLRNLSYSKKIEQDKLKAQKEPTTEESKKARNDRWQSMLDSGMPLTEIARETGGKLSTIRDNTVRSFKIDESYQWQDMRNYGFKIKEVAELFGVNFHLVAKYTRKKDYDPYRNEKLRTEVLSLRVNGKAAKEIAISLGITLSRVYKLAPHKKDTVGVSRLVFADLTKKLTLTDNGVVVGHYTPLERDSNAEEKDV